MRWRPGGTLVVLAFGAGGARTKSVVLIRSVRDARPWSQYNLCGHLDGLHGITETITLGSTASRDSSDWD
jgi:hypothetical protein